MPCSCKLKLIIWDTEWRRTPTWRVKAKELSKWGWFVVRWGRHWANICLFVLVEIGLSYSCYNLERYSDNLHCFTLLPHKPPFLLIPNSPYIHMERTSWVGSPNPYCLFSISLSLNYVKVTINCIICLMRDANKVSKETKKVNKVMDHLPIVAMAMWSFYWYFVIVYYPL